jgi:predicted RecB family nuclease
MKKIITPEIVVAHIQCPSKAYFMLCSDQVGLDSEYITALRDQKLVNQDLYLEYLKEQYPHTRKSNDENLANGNSLLINVKLESEEFEASCNVLTKVSVPSLLGQHSYEPIVVVGTHQIDSNQKLELLFIGYVLSRIQGSLPTTGKIISAGLKSHKVNLEKSYNILMPVIQDLQELIRKESPEAPSLILNKHCGCCQFQLSCRTKAEQEDNISLLAHATKKVVNHYEKKGIFTVRQLSYLYKPRRRNKRARKAPVVLHKIELQALAIRTNKTYIQELPQLVRKPFEIFLDMEGIPDQQYEYLIGLIVSNENSPPRNYSFWADNQEEEIIIWQQFIGIIKQYADAPIYHYGDYEVRAITRMVKCYGSEIEFENIKSRLININTYIYGQVYFPTYSNGLKDIGRFLGWLTDKTLASPV